MVSAGEPALPYRYPASARWLHWITLALILLLALCGIWMTVFEPKNEALKDALYDIHESTGIAVFFVIVLRLLRRMFNPPGMLPSRVPRGIRFAAHTNHILLYAVLLLQPVIGFLDTNAWGFPVTWARLIPLPSPIGHDETIAPILSEAHEWGAIVLLLLVTAHIAGAAWHGLVRRDGVVQRMI